MGHQLQLDSFPLLLIFIT